MYSPTSSGNRRLSPQLIEAVVRATTPSLSILAGAAADRQQQHLSVLSATCGSANTEATGTRLISWLPTFWSFFLSLVFSHLGLMGIGGRIVFGLASACVPSDHPSRSPPRRAEEISAVNRLIDLGIMEPVLRAFDEFLGGQNTFSSKWKEISRTRQLKRSGHRGRAMGVGGLCVDVRCGLLDTMQGGESAFHDMANAFRVDPFFSSDKWSDCQILRVVYRYGLTLQRFSSQAVGWPSCLFGILTSALHHAAGYLSIGQVQKVRTHFQRSADVASFFATCVLAGGVFGAGEIFIFDSLQQCITPVPFTEVVLSTFVHYVPGGTDLATKLVLIFRGEEAGYEPHARHEAGHSHSDTLSLFILPWLTDLAVDGVADSTQS